MRKGRKATARKKSVSGVKKTMTIGGKRFTKDSCHKTKTAAKKKAKAIRAKGYTARVVGNCVVKGAKSKAKRKRA